MDLRKTPTVPPSTGSAPSRLGFTGGADQCAAIDMDEITRRQGDLPEHVTFDSDTQSLDSPINDDTLSKLMDVLDNTFQPAEAPTLTKDRSECTGATITEPTSYCPESNMIFVDMPALAAAGAPKTEEEDEVLVQGDNTALSMVTSRYALAVQKERGVKIDTPGIGLAHGLSDRGGARADDRRGRR